MMESFFGSVQPMWSALPAQPLAWPQAGVPIARGSQPTAATIPAPPPMRFSAESLGYGPAALAFPGGFGLTGAYSPLATPELLSPTANAIVAAVAMRRGQTAAPANDAELEDFLNDALDVLPGTSDVEVRCEGGRATLTGSVPNKRYKHDVGEIAWAIPSITDVQNNVNIVARRRAARAAAREAEPQAAVRKHA